LDSIKISLPSHTVKTRNLLILNRDKYKNMAKNILLILSFFVVSLGYGQTVQIPISTNIQQRDGHSFYVHKVQKSQTVYSIAKAYHVGIDEIYYANPEAKNGLRIGQELWIPTVNRETTITKEVKKTNFDFFYHVAAGNESFAHISSIYVIPERYIHLANPSLKEPLKEGEYVKIPVESAFPILDGKVSNQDQAKTQYEGGLDIKQTTQAKPLHRSFTKTYTPVQNTEASRPVKSIQTPKPYTTPSIPVIKDYRHVVVRGETLESIARKYGISLSLLKQVNPGLRIAVQGQRLRLPQSANVPGYHAPRKTYPGATNTKANNRVSNKQKPQTKTKFIIHRVQKKETLYSISRKYGVSLNELYRANPGLNTNIKIGQSLRVPKKKITEPYLIYSSFKKISLKKIARLYQMDYALLKRKNPSVGRKVHAGQLVHIPLDENLIKELNKANEPSPATTVSAAKPKPDYTAPAMAASRCTARPHTRSFKVALMIPLYLEETDSLDINQFMLQDHKHFKPFRFVQFLEGALMAADSLQRQGMKLELHVYDVDEKLTKASKVLSKPELREMDLIIGPFYSRSFNQIALFANHFDIPIVNPLTFRSEVVKQFNKVVKVKPNKADELELLTRLIQEDYPNHKVFLIHQNTFQDTELIHSIRDSLQAMLPSNIKIANSRLIDYGIKVTKREKEAEQREALKESDSNEKVEPVQVSLSDTLHFFKMENQVVDPDSLKFFPEDSTQFTNNLTTILYATDSIHPFEQQASVIRQNLVILYGTQKSFVMDAMNRLNVLRDTFNVQMIGLPEWENFSNLDLNQMNNLEVTYPSSYFVDYHSGATQNYLNAFKARFKTDPETYGILGFDISYYFLESLYQYGKRMLNCLDKNPKAGISTEFQFAPSSQNENSFENTYWNLLRISNFEQLKRPLRTPDQTEKP
jgi:LysM repeat protein